MNTPPTISRESDERHPAMRPFLLCGDTLIYPKIGPCVVDEMNAREVFLRELNPSRGGQGDMICVPLDEFCQTLDTVRDTIERHALPIGLRVRISKHALYEVLGAPREDAEDGKVLLLKVAGRGPRKRQISLEDLRRSQEKRRMTKSA